MQAMQSTQPDIHGFLKSRSEWNEQVAIKLAEREGITLSQRHWDVIHYMRTEFYSNGGVVPLAHEINRFMGQLWNKTITEQDLKALFPLSPNKQAAKIAGCISMHTVKDLLDVKGDAVWSVSPEQDVLDAITLMSEKNIGAVVVVENNKMIGIVSERDFTRDVVTCREESTAEKSIREIMTNRVVAASPDDTLDLCMTTMTARGFRHLPVVDQDRVVGMLSMPDLVRIIVEQQQFTISQLQSEIKLAS